MPSFGQGKHEGNHGDHDASSQQATSDIDTMTGQPPGELVANGFAISSSPEDRKPLEPGQLTAKVWIRESGTRQLKAGR